MTASTAPGVLQDAIRYASRGRRVIALRGKRPITTRGACEGTTDPDVIRRWFTGTDYNVGLCLDGLLVVDIDPRNGGTESWNQLLGARSIPETLVQRSGADGLHYVFRSVETQVLGKPAPGVDVLTGPDRYIVAAPSIHPLSRQPYEWLDTRAPAPLPQWLLDVISRSAPPKMAPSFTQPQNVAVRFERAQRYLSRCEPAISGQGGHRRTFSVALKLAMQFPDLHEHDLLTLLTGWNVKCQPPWSISELQHKLTDAMQSASKQVRR